MYIYKNIYLCIEIYIHLHVYIFIYILCFYILNYIQLNKIHKYEVPFRKYSRVTLRIEILLAHLRLPNTMFGSPT